MSGKEWGTERGTWVSEERRKNEEHEGVIKGSRT